MINHSVLVVLHVYVASGATKYVHTGQGNQRQDRIRRGP